MKPLCISEAVSLGKPENLTLVLHILTCFAVPVNVYGAYCILFKTPKKMESVKLPLLTMHCISCTFDVFLSIVSIPYLYVPTLAGYPLGVWRSPIYQVYICFNFIGESAAAILLIFENRYNLLFGRHTWWQRVRIPYMIFNFLFTPVMVIPIILWVPDQESAVELVLQNMPCNPDYSHHPLFVLSLNPLMLFSIVMMLTITMTIEVLTFCGVLIIKMLRKDNGTSSLSQQTLEMQKRFVMALALQVALPIIVLFIPISYYALTTYFEHYDQMLNNLGVIFISVHGFLSTFTMVFVHHPYRKVTLHPYHTLRSRRNVSSYKNDAAAVKNDTLRN